LYYLKFPSNSKNNNNEYNYIPYSLPYLRIIYDSNPIDYYSIPQTRIFNPTFRTSRSNTIKFTTQIFDSDIDKENNNNNLGNSFILPKASSNIIASALFKRNLNNNNSFNEKFEYTIMPTNTFQ
jgi:hypothetical protein